MWRREVMSVVGWADAEKRKEGKEGVTERYICTEKH